MSGMSGSFPGPGAIPMDETSPSLTIKVGVSRMTFALHRGRSIWTMRSIATPPTVPFPVEQIRSVLAGLIGDDSATAVPGALVCVVPEIQKIIFAAWKDFSRIDLQLFSPERAPFTVEYRPPESLGTDRSAAVWGALDRFGESLGKTFMVADFGTHTVTTVCHEGLVLGGSIAPGLALERGAIGGGRVILESDPFLRNSLNRIDFLHGRRGIGRSTAEGIESGVVLGSVAAVEGLKRRAELEIGLPVTLVLTGGFSGFLAPLFFPDVLVNRQLVHHGAWKFLSCS